MFSIKGRPLNNSDDLENLKQEMQKLKTAAAKPPVVKFKKANFMDWFPFLNDILASWNQSILGIDYHLSNHLRNLETKIGMIFINRNAFYNFRQNQTKSHQENIESLNYADFHELEKLRWGFKIFLSYFSCLHRFWKP